MSRPPRPRSEGVIQRPLLVRAWAFVGVIEALLVMGAYFGVLVAAGWQPGDPVSVGDPLHDDYVTATTMTFAAIVACQVGVAMAARTDHASLRSVGLLSNRFLLVGIAFELVFAAVLIYVPLFQPIFHTAPLGPVELAVLLPLPVIVWGADELRRYLRRRRSRDSVGVE